MVVFYVLEWSNNRIQVFRQAGAESSSRAIIVAGGGPYPGNHLWMPLRCVPTLPIELSTPGFIKETIYYLTLVPVSTSTATA